MLYPDTAGGIGQAGDQADVPRGAEAVQGTVQVGIATVGAHGHCYKKKRTPQHESGKHDGGRWASSLCLALSAARAVTKFRGCLFPFGDFTFGMCGSHWMT